VTLTEVMSHAGFSGYAQLGFLVSLVAFVGLVAWVVLRPKAEMQAHAQAVLNDDQDDRAEGRQP
jgi:hypothetical protein